MKNPYEILGLSQASGEDELRARYSELKSRYSEQRFRDGEEGNEGARRLMELEDAWSLISADLQRRNYNANSANDFARIDELIKNGRYDDAQKQLDDVSLRTAEWHYYQSIIYYKREWLNESRKQLAMAVSMDPNNPKYKEALFKMDSLMGNPNVNPQSFGQDPNGQRYATQNDINNTLCRVCQAYICADCLCSLMSSCCR